MSYTKDVGEVSARYRPGGEVPSVTYPSGTHVVFTAPGSATNGQYGLFEWNMTGTRGGADPHFHKTFSESFYVTDGTVRLFNGETWIDAVKGDFLYVPQGGIHAFSNESGVPARMLILFAPGPPREEYFSELAEIRSAGRTLTDEEWIEVWARHDQYPAAGVPAVRERHGTRTGRRTGALFLAAKYAGYACKRAFQANPELLRLPSRLETMPGPGSKAERARPAEDRG